MKRIFDVVIAVMAIIIFSPVILIVGLMINLKLGRPILFKQE
ncbi:sugar transferase, partial [Oleiphilus sp. HI0132]